MAEMLELGTDGTYSSRSKSVVAPKPHRFLTLDALRGVAAIGVVSSHTSRLFGRNPFVHGYLAVDFFFMLSGFVLAYAYQDKLDRGWGTLSFLKVRLARFYPLYLMGLLLGVLFTILQSRYGKSHMALGDFALYVGLGLAFLPGLSPDYGLSMVYPFNGPTWSLFLELVVNFLHATLLRNRSTRTLCFIVAISSICLSFSVIEHGGFNYFYIGVCLFRVIFSYTLGMILLRVWAASKRKRSLFPVLPAIVLMVSLAIPLPA